MEKTINVIVDLNKRDSEGIPSVKCDSGVFKLSFNDTVEFAVTVRENGKTWTWKIADVTADFNIQKIMEEKASE